MHRMECDVLEVKADGTHDKFIRGQALRDDESVIYNVAAKDQAGSDCINDVHRLSKRNEQVNEPNHHCGINVRF